MFDFDGSSPPCRGPMNSVLATTLSSVYLAMRHVFPEVPISAGAFEPLEILRPEGTFLDAHYPRPVSGCAAEVSQRIAEAVFAAMVQPLPDRVTAAPAGTSGNFALGGHNAERGRDFVMYQLSGGGYVGNADGDVLSNGCSTIGISKAPPLKSWSRPFRFSITITRFMRVPPGPAAHAAVSDLITSSSFATARRVPASSWITAGSVRRAFLADVTAM